MPSPQAALIGAMVLAAGSGRALAQAEIDIIGDLVHHLPFFGGVERGQVAELATQWSERQAAPGGVERAYGQIRGVLSRPLREAAYALSCDVVAICRPQQAEQALAPIRVRLKIDPATASTIERAARVRSQAA
jgi:hypothetical protein